MKRISTQGILLGLAIGLIVLALAFSICLLAGNTGAAWGLPAGAISSVPLLAAGLAFLLVQPALRQRWAEVMKNTLLAATFLLWGVVQLMAQNLLSKKLGDVVIALYVIDIAWTIFANVIPTGGKPE